MGIASNAILILSGVYLALGVIYLRFWWAERPRLSYLAFTISCFSYMIFAWFEAGMLKAATPEEYLFYAWWAFIPGSVGILAFAWFAYLHLHGRKWLFWAYGAMRILALVLHLSMANGIHFREITSIGHRTVLGESLSYPISVANPWMLLPQLSHIVLVIFFLDSSLRCWRRGERQTAIVFGTGTIIFGLTTLIIPTSILWGLVSIPLIASVSVLFIVLAMLYELNYDMHRSAMLAGKLEEREARLTDTLDQLQIAASAGNVGMWIRSVDGEIVWASEKAGEIWGFPNGEGFTQNDLIEKLHPDDRERVMACVGDMASGKDYYLVEFRILGEDGDIKWIQSQGRIDTVNGERTVRGAIIDITRLKMAETAVQESEARFRNMAETAPVMIWVSDENQATTYANQQYLELTGRTLNQELGRDWARHLHSDDVDAAVEKNMLAFEKRIPIEQEFRVRRTDGEYRWIFSSGKPRFSSDGEFLGYIGTSIDITERKQAERELKQAHDELNKLKNQLEAENIYLQEELRQDQAIGGIVGESSAIKQVLLKISQVAPTDTTVLIAGETGTGKELIAHAIHDGSRRNDRPLIKVNCAALSPTLIESELFGHERGAFTGAAGRKLGRFELANTGTIFLDEIGELPLDLQSKLLRVLQESEFERVGGGKTIKTDVRVIAATNRDLKQSVKNGTFREDLWYRLNVFPITSPALRDRRDDIPLLTEHFARIFARKLGKDITGVSPETMSALCQYSWPGNVRELANVIERAVINLRGTVLKIQEDFQMWEADTVTESVQTLEEMERKHIVQALEGLNWRIDGPKGAARVLGINPSTLRTRMDKLGIVKPNGRPRVKTSE